MDYLVEEVLQQQPESVQTFLLRTSILDRLCGLLCDAVVRDPTPPVASGHSGQATLEYLEHANLFLVPLDSERQWYRYHHLFADLLRQRLRQSAASSPEDEGWHVAELHIRASQWYEDHGLDIEAFHHAAAAGDIERAERLIEGRGIPLHFRGAVMAILDWFGSLPTSVLDAKPSRWAQYASLMLVNGQTTGVDEKLDAAEAALQGAEENDEIRNLFGQIAAARGVLALTRYQPETMIVQSRRALEYLGADNLFLRATATWTLGYAHFFLGDRAAAREIVTEAISLSQACGDIFDAIIATIGLGNVQEVDIQLYQAAETYQRVLQWTGDQPLQIIYEAHLGLARVLYEWNDLEAAERHGQRSLELARQYDTIIDRFVVCEIFLARLKLARGDVAGAAALLAQTWQSARQQSFVFRIPEIVAAQVLTLLHQGNLAEAAHLAQAHALPISQARVHLAQDDPSAALAALEPWRRHVEAKGWEDERLKVLVLQALAFHAQGATDKAVQVLLDALALAEPGGFIRTFVDEGRPMAQLLATADAHGRMPDYIGKLRSACDAEDQQPGETPQRPPASLALPVSPAQPLIEPLSRREKEVLQLIAHGLSNQEISERLFLALDTVKGHNRSIFSKLQVQRRTEAVARARSLGLL